NGTLTFGWRQLYPPLSGKQIQLTYPQRPGKNSSEKWMWQSTESSSTRLICQPVHDFRADNTFNSKQLFDGLRWTSYIYSDTGIKTTMIPSLSNKNSPYQNQGIHLSSKPGCH
ncbi:unnamed protein product, partial [Ectocarpus sp. 6 AP-2014]